MHVGVVSIFPELFTSFVSTSLVGAAVERGLMAIEVEDLRRFTEDRHQSVDDEPYGGGGGMVMTAEPWLAAIDELATADTWTVMLSPQGRPLTDAKVRQLAERQRLLLLCGRYEGVDERVLTRVDEEISIGDFVLSGGELPSMVLIEAVSRQVPGVVGRPSSVVGDSFRDGLLDHPHYTRPRSVAGLEVPPVLLSGDHQAIAGWRRREAMRATLRKRPDLLAVAGLGKRRRSELAEVAAEEGIAEEELARLVRPDSTEDNGKKGAPLVGG
jgi:tRNA (guanine37-N1)-methyltransferase